MRTHLVGLKTAVVVEETVDEVETVTEEEVVVEVVVVWLYLLALGNVSSRAATGGAWT
jgi:hypothetical protein